MTKKSTKGDGRPMTADDLQRLHDYLVDMEAISAISDQMRTVVESDGPSSPTNCPLGNEE
jgi:hypothetical protein